MNFLSNMGQLDKAPGLATQIAHIEPIRRIIGEEKLILIGCSFGGFLSRLHAVEFPDRVEGMILVSTADVLVMRQERRGSYEQVQALLPGSQMPTRSSLALRGIRV